MNKKINFEEIKQYNKYVIKITKDDYSKMQYCINKLKLKYDSVIDNLYYLEDINTKKYNFNRQIDFINKQKDLIVNIIKDVLKIYEKELNNLEVVFLSGSFARSTNKMSSDLDLHFFYKDNYYNYIYEEIVLYIISRVINKSRDSIDPTFILNIEEYNKEIITKKMDKNKLNIILKYKNKQIKYSYKYGKKRRFYLQYINTRRVDELFKYLDNQIIKHNSEWCHCFEVIKGKEIFNNLYNKLYTKELKIINSNYIYNKVILLKKQINNSSFNIKNNFICDYKYKYQSITFKWIYEYISIIRFILIEQKQNVKYLNLLDIYKLSKKNTNINKKIFNKIYKYMWSLEKMTVYCYKNNINYGLHNNDVINYQTKELDNNLRNLKEVILKDLERIEILYGKSYSNTPYDASRWK